MNLFLNGLVRVIQDHEKICNKRLDNIQVASSKISKSENIVCSHRGVSSSQERQDCANILLETPLLVGHHLA
jgi:hypothetical protein